MADRRAGRSEPVRGLRSGGRLRGGRPVRSAPAPRRRRKCNAGSGGPNGCAGTRPGFAPGPERPAVAPRGARDPSRRCAVAEPPPPGAAAGRSDPRGSVGLRHVVPTLPLRPAARRRAGFASRFEARPPCLRRSGPETTWRPGSPASLPSPAPTQASLSLLPARPHRRHGDRRKHLHDGGTRPAPPPTPPRRPRSPLRGRRGRERPRGGAWDERVVSKYDTPHGPLYVITEGDRSSTTVLFPRRVLSDASG